MTRIYLVQLSISCWLRTDMNEIQNYELLKIGGWLEDSKLHCVKWKNRLSYWYPFLALKINNTETSHAVKSFERLLCNKWELLLQPIRTDSQMWNESQKLYQGNKWLITCAKWCKKCYVCHVGPPCLYPIICYFSHYGRYNMAAISQAAFQIDFFDEKFCLSIQISRNGRVLTRKFKFGDKWN